LPSSCHAISRSSFNHGGAEKHPAADTALERLNRQGSSLKFHTVPGIDECLHAPNFDTRSGELIATRTSPERGRHAVCRRDGRFDSRRSESQPPNSDCTGLRQRPVRSLELSAQRDDGPGSDADIATARRLSIVRCFPVSNETASQPRRA
jgi:hypothetical protein